MLNPLDKGSFAGLSMDEIARCHPDFHARISRDHLNTRFPGRPSGGVGGGRPRAEERPGGGSGSARGGAVDGRSARQRVVVRSMYALRLTMPAASPAPQGVSATAI